MINASVLEDLHHRVEYYRSDIVQFLREIVAIPSIDSQIGPVSERIRAEMIKLNFDEVRFDKMGNIFGKIGNGDLTKIGRASGREMV